MASTECNLCYARVDKPLYNTLRAMKGEEPVDYQIPLCRSCYSWDSSNVYTTAARRVYESKP